MENIYTELALYGSKNECARTDTVFLPISEVCNGMVSLPEGRDKELSPLEVPKMLTLSFEAGPLRILSASSGLTSGDSFSTLAFGLVTVAFIV